MACRSPAFTHLRGSLLLRSRWPCGSPRRPVECSVIETGYFRRARDLRDAVEQYYRFADSMANETRKRCAPSRCSRAIPWRACPDARVRRVHPRGGLHVLASLWTALMRPRRARPR